MGVIPSTRMNIITDENNLSGLIDELDRIISECPTINEGTQSVLRTRLIKMRSRTQQTITNANSVCVDLFVRLQKKESDFKLASALLADK